MVTVFFSVYVYQVNLFHTRVICEQKSMSSDKNCLRALEATSFVIMPFICRVKKYILHERRQ